MDLKENESQNIVKNLQMAKFSHAGEEVVNMEHKKTKTIRSMAAQLRLLCLSW